MPSKRFYGDALNPARVYYGPCPFNTFEALGTDRKARRRQTLPKSQPGKLRDIGDPPLYIQFQTLEFSLDFPIQ